MVNTNVELLMTAMLPLLEIVYSELEDNDAAGEDWHAGMDFSSYDHRNQMGALHNGEPFHTGKTAGGVDYLYTYDLNDSGGERHIVYVDPQTSQAVFLIHTLGLTYADRADFAMELDFDADADKLPAELRATEEPHVVSIDDMPVFIDSIISAGGPEAYLQRLQSTISID